MRWLPVVVCTIVAGLYVIALAANDWSYDKAGAALGWAAAAIAWDSSRRWWNTCDLFEDTARRALRLVKDYDLAAKTARGEFTYQNFPTGGV